MQQVNAPSVRWEWIGEAWNLFTKQWSVWVLMILVTYLVVGLIYMPLYFIAILSMVPCSLRGWSCYSGVRDFFQS